MRRQPIGNAPLAEFIYPRQRLEEIGYASRVPTPTRRVFHPQPIRFALVIPPVFEKGNSQRCLGDVAKRLPRRHADAEERVPDDAEAGAC